MEQSTGKCWRDVYGPEELVQRVRPKESDEYIPNPHKGTATYQRFNGEASEPIDGSWNDGGPFARLPFSGTLHNVGYPDTTIAYLRWEWAKLEPERGKRKWEMLDEHLKIAKERGQTVQFRLNPYSETAPAWYWKAGGKRSNGSPNEPDTNTGLWFECFSDAIRDLGRRYDGHPVLESVDTVYGGLWGEGGGDAVRETREKFIDVYREVFKKTPLMVMEGNDDLAYAAKTGLGWRADCFGDMRTGTGPGKVPDHLCWNHMYDRYPAMLWDSGAQDAWKNGPVTMETCWHVGWWFRQGWDIDWIIEHGYKYHMSVFMPKSCAIPEEWAEKFVNFNKKMGYRFVLRQLSLPLEAKAGQEIEVRAWIDNIGCAPIYRPYEFVYRLKQGKKTEIVSSASDIRKWMPEYTCFTDKVRIPASFEKGDVSIDVGIVDESLTPKVRLAIQETALDGWHPMTFLEVK